MPGRRQRVGSPRRYRIGDGHGARERSVPIAVHPERSFPSRSATVYGASSALGGGCSRRTSAGRNSMSTRTTRAALAGPLVLTSFVSATPALAKTRSATTTDHVAQATANEYIVLARYGSTVAAVEAAVQRA